MLTDCRSSVDIMDFLPGRAEDVSASVGWLGEQAGADMGRVGLAGCSHGAAVRLLSAPAGEYRSVVAQASGTSIAQPALGIERMSATLSETHPPILLQDAEDDLPCPIETSRTLYRHARQEGKNITLREFQPAAGINGHSQFDFSNRAIWAADFDAALEPVVGDRPCVVAH